VHVSRSGVVLVILSNTIGEIYMYDTNSESRRRVGLGLARGLGLGLARKKNYVFLDLLLQTGCTQYMGQDGGGSHQFDATFVPTPATSQRKRKKNDRENFACC
jgi:hypothetical protein